MWGLGSFTGIRIGIASIKAMAESLNIPVVSVSSLEALAYNISGIDCNTICSIIDARNNQVYAGIFDKNYNLLQDYIADDINTLLNHLKKYTNTLFVGDGAIAYKEIITQSFSNSNFIENNNT